MPLQNDLVFPDSWTEQMKDYAISEQWDQATVDQADTYQVPDGVSCVPPINCSGCTNTGCNSPFNNSGNADSNDDPPTQGQ